MFYQLHRYTRKVIIGYIQELLDDHPMFTSDRPDPIFQSTPVTVVDKFNFDGIHFPAVVVNSTDSSEQRLAMDRLITEERGYVRMSGMMPYVAPVVTIDREFTGTREDGVYLLEFVESMAEDDEEIKLRVASVLAVGDTQHDNNPPAGGFQFRYFDVEEDARRTDIVPGAEVYFGSFNDIRPGTKMYVETFADQRYLGNIYGSRYTVNMGIDVYAKSPYETEELTDLINAWFTYYIPHQIFFKHHINLTKCGTDGVVDKEGRFGEEVFKGRINITMSVEHQFFVPVDIATSYNLWLVLRKELDNAAEEIVIPLVTE